MLKPTLCAAALFLALTAPPHYVHALSLPSFLDSNPLAHFHLFIRASAGASSSGSSSSSSAASAGSGSRSGGTTSSSPAGTRYIGGGAGIDDSGDSGSSDDEGETSSDGADDGIDDETGSDDGGGNSTITSIPAASVGDGDGSGDMASQGAKVVEMSGMAAGKIAPVGMSVVGAVMVGL